MSTNHTANYDLCQWEATDQVLRTDFNQDNAKLDAALKSLSDQKASQSALNALISTVSQKADASTVSSLSQIVAAKADQSALTAQAVAHTADVNTLRSENCWVKLGQVDLLTDQAQVNFDLSGIQLSQFRFLELQGEFNFADVVTAGIQFDNNTYYSFSGPGGRGVPYATFFYNEQTFSSFVRIQKCLFRTSSLVVYSLGASYGYSSEIAGVSSYGDDPQFENIQSMQILGVDQDSTPVMLKAGTSVSLYGLKK